MARRECRSHAEGSFPTDVGRLNLWQADGAADVGWRRPGGTKFAQAGGLGGFRELAPGGVQNQTMMPVGRLRQTEKRLQQPMQAGRPEQVLTTYYLRDALQGVV